MPNYYFFSLVYVLAGSVVTNSLDFNEITDQEFNTRIISYFKTYILLNVESMHPLPPNGIVWVIQEMLLFLQSESMVQFGKNKRFNTIKFNFIPKSSGSLIDLAYTTHPPVIFSHKGINYSCAHTIHSIIPCVKKNNYSSACSTISTSALNTLHNTKITVDKSLLKILKEVMPSSHNSRNSIKAQLFDLNRGFVFDKKQKQMEVSKLW